MWNWCQDQTESQLATRRKGQGPGSLDQWLVIIDPHLIFTLLILEDRLFACYFPCVSSASICWLLVFLFLSLFFPICCCYHSSLVFALSTLCKRTHQSKTCKFFSSPLNLMEPLCPPIFPSFGKIQRTTNNISRFKPVFFAEIKQHQIAE